MQRRRFLVLGLTGAAVLAAAGTWSWLQGRRGTAAHDEAEAVVAALVRAMLDGALPADGHRRAEAVRETVDNFGRAVAGLPPVTRAELAQLFTLLASPVGRRLFAGVAPPWSDATVSEVSAALDAWQASGWALKRSAYDGLHQLIMASWYGNPRSWDGIGYPGPPTLA